MAMLTRCERRGHRWRVLGFDPANSVFKALVFLRCTRCQEGITAEILSVGEAEG